MNQGGWIWKRSEAWIAGLPSWTDIDIFTKRRLYFYSEGHVYVHVRTYAQLSLSHAIYFAWALGYTSIRYHASSPRTQVISFLQNKERFDNKITKF